MRSFWARLAFGDERALRDCAHRGAGAASVQQRWPGLVRAYGGGGLAVLGVEFGGSEGSNSYCTGEGGKMSQARSTSTADSSRLTNNVVHWSTAAPGNCRLQCCGGARVRCDQIGVVARRAGREYAVLPRLVCQAEYRVRRQNPVEDLKAISCSAPPSARHVRAGGTDVDR